MDGQTGAGSYTVEVVRKSYVLDIHGRTATLEMVSSAREPDRSLFPAPWRVVDLGSAFVAWRLLI